MDIFGKYNDLMAQGRPNGRPVGVRDGMGQQPRQVSSPALGGQVNTPGSIVGGPLPLGGGPIPGAPTGPMDFSRNSGSGPLGPPPNMINVPAEQFGGNTEGMDISKILASRSGVASPLDGWREIGTRIGALPPPNLGYANPIEGQQSNVAQYIQSLRGNGFQGLGARAQANQAQRAQTKAGRQAKRRAVPGRVDDRQGVL